MTPRHARRDVAGAWILLGGVGLASFPDAFTTFWGGALGVPWLLGGTLILWMSAERVAAAARLPVERRSVRLALLTLGTLLTAVAVFLTAPAAVLAVVWLGSGALGVLAAGGPDRLADVTVNASVAGVALALSVGVMELVLRHPELARRWGSPQERAAWEERYDGLWRHNALGLRSPYETMTPPDGTLRILALGDSFTWGDKVADADSTWPAVLERTLERRRSGTDVQVVNAGRRGFTTANEAEWLRRLGWQMEPDVVVWQFFVNDVFPSGPNFQSPGSGSVFGHVRLLPVRFQSGPAGASALVALLESRLNGLLGPRLDERYAPLYREGAEGWQQVQTALAEVGTAAEERGVHVLFFVVPAFTPGDWNREDHPHAVIHRKVVRAAEASGLRPLDLTPAFAAASEDGESWQATPYDAHPSPQAHRLIGRRIASELRAADLP